MGLGGGGRPGKPDDEKERDLLKVGLGGRIEEKLQDLFERTAQLVHDNRVQVLAVTHALETNKTLTGDDIEAVIEAREGPLIDGRVYGAPEFEGIAEAYHAEVLDAHARHGKVEVPLPKLNGQRGDIGPLAELDPQGTKGNGGTTADEPAEETEPTA